jgi:heme/copper-type cytochrome/quinol oxidase subunit 2
MKGVNMARIMIPKEEFLRRQSEIEDNNNPLKINIPLIPIIIFIIATVVAVISYKKMNNDLVE